MAQLQSLYQSFPKESESLSSISRIEQNLEKSLGITRARLFYYADQKWNLSKSDSDSDRALLEKAYSRILPKGPAGFGWAKDLSKHGEWMGYWPIWVNGGLVAFYALGWKKGKKELSSEEKGLMELLCQRTSSFFEVRLLSDQLEKADRLSTLGLMISFILHEIRNPLTAMDALIQIFPQKKTDSDFLESFHTLMAREITRLKKFTQTALDFSKPGKKSFERVDLCQTILKVMEMLETSYGHQKKRTKLKLPPNLFLYGNAYQLESLVMNLVQNAFQSVGKNGLVEIEAGYLNLKGKKAGRLVEFKIRDNGKGFTKESIEQVFKPFFSTKEEGTGLGLAICKKVVNNHSGEINVKSTPGRKTEFTILLPIDSTAEVFSQKN